MKKTILLLMGASGCGKSTLEKQLINHGDVYRVVSTSTREMRRKEVHGVSYHFVTDQQFRLMMKGDEFIQTTEFAGNKYGTTKMEYTTDHPIAVLSIVPVSAVEFIPVLRETFPDYDIKIVYFDISKERLRNNMLARGDTEKEVALRMTHDNLVEQFTDAGFVPDVTLTDDLLDDNVANLVRDKLKI